MSMFSRQPELPAQRPEAAAPEATANARIPHPISHFAIVGVDQETGQPVNAVIEARSEDDAQAIAQKQGIIVDEFKPMHSLAAAAAIDLTPSEAQGSGGLQPTAPGPGVPGAVREAPTSHPLGILAVLAVVAAVGGLLYVSVLRDGGLQRTLAMVTPSPPEVEAAFDVTEPLGVDLSQIEGYEEWTDVRSLDPVEHRPGDKLRLEATIPPTTSGRGHRGSAVIGGQIIKPGESVAGYRLVKVRDGSVLLQKDNKLVVLRIAAESN